MTERGFSRLGPAVRNQMMSGGLIGYTIDTRASTCYVSVAIGVEGLDLNMFLLDPMGRTVETNVRPDNHPFVYSCPASGGRHMSRVQAASGQGEYIYVAYYGPPNEPHLASAFGETEDSQEIQTASLDAETGARLTQLDAALAPQRYSRVGEPQGVVLAEHAEQNFPLNLQRGFCYQFATFGGPGTRDTDISIEDGGGQMIESDTESSRDAKVEFCPPSDGVYRLRATMYGGSGPLFVAGWVKPNAPAAPAAPTQQGPVISESSSAGVSLEETFAMLDADIQARGYTQYGEYSNGNLSEGQTESISISLEGGKCYAILAVGDSGIRDLDVHLRRGRTDVDHDDGTNARPIVRTCVENTGTHAIDVQAVSGSGAFRYHAYRWPRGTSGPFGLSGLIYVRLGEVTSLHSVEGYEPSAEFEPGQGDFRREGDSATHRIDLPAGTCFSIPVVGGAGVYDLNVTLSKDGQEVATDGTHNAFPSVRHCTTEAGTHELKVQAGQGRGEYFYQVFQLAE